MNIATDRLAPNEPDIASKIIDGEAILIDLSTGAYFSLRDTGAVIWQALRGHRTEHEIRQVLEHLYGSDAAGVATDLGAFLAELAAERLIRVSTESGVVEVSDSAIPSHGYAAPVLEKFTDMEELLALDPPTPGALDGLIRRPIE